MILQFRRFYIISSTVLPRVVFFHYCGVKFIVHWLSVVYLLSMLLVLVVLKLDTQISM